MGLLVMCCFYATAQVRVLTVAGGYVGDGTPATSAALQFPQYAAIDRAGNFYISDYFSHRIRRVSTNGTITTLAGTGIAGFSGDSGRAKLAKINFPAGIVVDPQRNVVFCDSANNRIRKIDNTGVITTIAGTGVAGFSGDHGPATAAMINQPYGLALDSQGNLFFADLGNQRIRKIDKNDVITTVAGTGEAGFGGDGGPATSAELNGPEAVIPDSAGNLYIADTQNSRVRKVDGAGKISTFAGGGFAGCNDDGVPATQARLGRVRGFAIHQGKLVISNAGCGFIRAVDFKTGLIATVAGTEIAIGTGGFDGNGHAALSSAFLNPTGLVFDRSNNLFIVDSGNDQVRKLDASTQLVTAFAGGYVGDGGPGTGASLNLSADMKFDAQGDLYIAETFGHRIRRMSSKGTITTYAGIGISDISGDGGPASSAALAFPLSIATDGKGNLFIADLFGTIIRKVDQSGTISTFVPGNSDFNLIGAMVADTQGNLYAADEGRCVVWKITSAGTYSVVAGVLDFCDYNSDGIPAASAYLNGPDGITMRNGNLYISDWGNNRIRKVNTSGIISTVAGNGVCGFSGNGGRATAAEICAPAGIAIDSKGNLYIGDFNNLRVRKVDSAGTITTFAGSGKSGYNGDGLPAANTNLDAPISVAVSPSGVVYVDDSVQYRVREIH